jgi:hypothetical protein
MREWGMSDGERGTCTVASEGRWRRRRQWVAIARQDAVQHTGRVCGLLRINAVPRGMEYMTKQFPLVFHEHSNFSNDEKRIGRMAAALGTAGIGRPGRAGRPSALTRI